MDFEEKRERLKNKKKEDKMKKYFLIYLIVMLISSASFASAAFKIGNYSIETEYGGGEFLKGWINISLQDEKADSTISCFNSNITILDLLEKSGVSFECVPDDCEAYYKAEGSGSSVKSFSLNKLESKIVGLKFQGGLKDSPIQSISFKVESNAGSGCFQPLKIDILDDGEIEWYSFSTSNEFSCSVSTGCFNFSERLSEYNIGTTPYCQKITLSPQPNFQVGAYIIKGTTISPEFKMKVYNANLEELSKCTLPEIDSSGEKSCTASLNFTGIEDVFVCIEANKATDYKINGESAEPCGFYGLDYEDFTSDYYIFAKGSKYASLGSFVFDENEFEKYNADSLKDYIETYLNKFENNCTNGCIVPLKFISGINQGISLSNLQLSYDTKSGLRNENNFYDASKESAKINADFIKLDLKEGNFSVPYTDGDYKARIYLNENLIAEEEIKVFASTSITGLNSQEVPAAVPYKFVVYVSATKNITSYNWDFGDGTTEKTIKNETIHTYSKIGEYNLKIETVDSLGKKAIKSFLIKVSSPKDYIKLSLRMKRENLNETIKQLNAITAWYKEEAKKKANLDEIEKQLKYLEEKYNAASTDSEYVAIMSNLTGLKVPYSLQISKFSGDFFPNAENIKPEYLIELGAKADNPEGYKESIVSWFNEYIEMKIDSDTPYLYYSDEQIPLLTALTLKIKPKEDFDKKSYLIIDESYENVIFKESYNEKAAGEATAITFSKLEKDTEKIIEFILPEKIEILQFLVYISPEFSELPEVGKISPCNNNGACEKEIGETNENCANDCKTKPWKKIMLWMLILLFAAFVVYIALQEWYKRYYESHLFKDKNNFFNLMNFIVNALNQGFSRREIIEKLKEYKWSNEQINYALKKVQGKRTGMWEIPIFRPFEKKKIKKELEKRRQLGLQLPKQS